MIVYPEQIYHERIKVLEAENERLRKDERTKITKWLRSLDEESGDINGFVPTTLANWIDEGMHEL